jgi:hypothetical protein
MRPARSPIRALRGLRTAPVPRATFPSLKPQSARRARHFAGRASDPVWADRQLTRHSHSENLYANFILLPHVCSTFDAISSLCRSLSAPQRRIGSLCRRSSSAKVGPSLSTVGGEFLSSNAIKPRSRRGNPQLADARCHGARRRRLRNRSRRQRLLGAVADRRAVMVVVRAGQVRVQHIGHEVAARTARAGRCGGVPGSINRERYARSQIAARAATSTVRMRRVRQAQPR